MCVSFGIFVEHPTQISVRGHERGGDLQRKRNRKSTINKGGNGTGRIKGVVIRGQDRGGNTREG